MREVESSHQQVWFVLQQNMYWKVSLHHASSPGGFFWECRKQFSGVRQSFIGKLWKFSFKALILIGSIGLSRQSGSGERE